MPHSIAPVTKEERIQTIDIVRGFALLGILIVNFKNTISNNSGPWTGTSDMSVKWFIMYFMNDKFWPIYTLLFGLGFALQMERAAARQSFFGWIYLRRMLVLYVIGVIQIILTADSVVQDYAMIGVLLLLFRKVPVRFLPWIAIILMLIPITRNEIVNWRMTGKENSQAVKVDSTILEKYVGVYGNPGGPILIFRRSGDTLIGEGPARQFILTPLSDSHFIRKDLGHTLTFIKDTTGAISKLNVLLPDGSNVRAKKIETDFQEALNKQIQQRTNPITRPRSATYTEYVNERANNFWNGFKGMTWQKIAWGPYIEFLLVLMLFGAYAGRRKVFSNVRGNRNFLRKVMFWGLLIGFIGIAIDAGTNWNHSKNLYIYDITGIFLSHYILFLSFGYVAALTLLVENKTWKRRLSFFAPVGQMGLTSYILHTIALTVVFEKFAFRLLGKVGQFYGLLLSIGVFIIIYFLSRLWLNYFRMGPFEWLWRSLTYWKIQPMRLKPTDISIETKTGVI